MRKNLFVLYIGQATKIFDANYCNFNIPSKLGCINDPLLSINIKTKNIGFEFYINLYQDLDSFENVSKPFNWLF